ncbi:MAG: hypothetical protein OXG35_04365 [Acidobacteria bacterium]|nr:hypothetical protein [Acidobacteriota bacterium]
MAVAVVADWLGETGQTEALEALRAIVAIPELGDGEPVPLSEVLSSERVYRMLEDAGKRRPQYLIAAAGSLPKLPSTTFTEKAEVMFPPGTPMFGSPEADEREEIAASLDAVEADSPPAWLVNGLDGGDLEAVKHAHRIGYRAARDAAQAVSVAPLVGEKSPEATAGALRFWWTGDSTGDAILYGLPPSAAAACIGAVKGWGAGTGSIERRLGLHDEAEGDQ